MLQRRALGAAKGSFMASFGRKEVGRRRCGGMEVEMAVAWWVSQGAGGKLVVGMDDGGLFGGGEK